MKRRITKQLHIGDVKIGGDAPITVQSMTKTDTRDVAATVQQIHGLEEAGCEIVRSAVPDMEAAKALAPIKKQTRIPLVADIHFHYELALEAPQKRRGLPAPKPRQHPRRRKGAHRRPGGQGARGAHTHRRKTSEASRPSEASASPGASPGTPTASTSSPRAAAAMTSTPSWTHMVATGLWEIGILEDLDFDLIKISLKAFDIDTTVESYRRHGRPGPYPFHSASPRPAPPGPAAFAAPSASAPSYTRASATP